MKIPWSVGSEMSGNSLNNPAYQVLPILPKTALQIIVVHLNLKILAINS